MSTDLVYGMLNSKSFYQHAVLSTYSVSHNNYPVNLSAVPIAKQNCSRLKNILRVQLFYGGLLLLQGVIEYSKRHPGLLDWLLKL